MGKIKLGIRSGIELSARQETWQPSNKMLEKITASLYSVCLRN